jgi:two-component system sensor histidine kinase DctS
MSRRWLLWSLLAALVLGMLMVLVWLAGRYEKSRWQDLLEHDAQQAVLDLKSGMQRNAQRAQILVLPDTAVEGFRAEAQRLLRDRREIRLIERRQESGSLQFTLTTPYASLPGSAVGVSWRTAHQTACANARRLASPAYSPSEYIPYGDGRGEEWLTLCVPVNANGQPDGYILMTYSLPALLAEWVPDRIRRGREVSLTEGDGTRLAVQGQAQGGMTRGQSQQVLDLPGAPMVLKLEAWRGAPELFPNVLTALVAALTLGMVIVMLLLGHDMRRRQKAENELAESFAFRKAMEDSLVTGLRARDTQGRITYVNPAFCEMVGFSARELLGQSIPAPYWPPEQIEEYRQRQSVRLAGTAPPREGYESVFMRKDGTRFPVLVFEAPLINAQGEQAGWMSAVLDMTEQRRMEEVSRASQDRLQATARLATVGEMASLLSHELNQPLAAISSYATGSMNLLAQPGVVAPDLREALGRIAQQADRAGRVIKSVHDFVRRRQDERQQVSAADLLDAVKPLIELQARKSGVKLNIRVAAGLPDCVCDRTMVEQVLLNLARNGMQAMQASAADQKLLDIDVHQTSPDAGPGSLIFTVTDRGTGIDPEVATQLFTPFFTTKAEGMGLGLSMCRTVVEQHGGYLEYQANQPCGTVFVFTLPATRKTQP